MDILEIASQLTMKALETGSISLIRANLSYGNEQLAKSINEFNMKAVGDFYREMVNAVGYATQPQD